MLFKMGASFFGLENLPKRDRTVKNSIEQVKILAEGVFR